MAVPNSVDTGTFLREQLESASPDLLRAMIKTFAEALMSAEADAVCGAPYGERSPERVNSRNGYRGREWDTRAGTVELAIPKLRQGSYFPERGPHGGSQGAAGCRGRNATGIRRAAAAAGRRGRGRSPPGRPRSTAWPVARRRTP